MTARLKYLLIVIFVLFCTWGGVLGQSSSSIEVLRVQIQKAEAEIKLSTELLNKTLKSQKLSQSQLKLIRSRISNRREIVNTLEKQIRLIESDIDSKNKKIKSLDGDLTKLRAEYADMVKEAYKNYKLNNFMLFLFASEDFNDATRRVDFMRRYNRMRELKAGQIRTMTDSIGIEVSTLDKQKAELAQTKQTKGSEITTLGKDEGQYKTSVAKLKTEEEKIKKQLATKRKQIEDAQKSIQKIIAEEAKKAKGEKRTAAEDRYITELSGRFDENMGKLPYPVSGGVVIDRYGSHAHPTQPGMIINNKGLNIAAARDTEVMCVFEGSVTKVFSLPGLNNCVMVRHGNYITLYANLASISVKTGDKVALNQRLGRLADSTNSDDNYLHFEIWRETTNLNPEQWLRR